MKTYRQEFEKETRKSKIIDEYIGSPLAKGLTRQDLYKMLGE